MFHEVSLMDLRPSCKYSSNKGDSEAAAEVSQKIVYRCGISHVLFFHARHCHCCEWYKEESHSNAEYNPRPDDCIKIGKEIKPGHEIGRICSHDYAECKQSLRIYLRHEPSSYRHGNEGR